MKRLMRKASPEIGEKVKLTDDERYIDDNANKLSLVSERDAPIVIMKGKVYYGESNVVNHYELWLKALKDNDLVPGDHVDDSELGVAYYVNNFLGAPSVFIYEDQNRNNQVQLIKEDRPDVSVYVVSGSGNDILTRVASRLKNIKLPIIVEKL
jgi:hypothetical protein